MILRISVGPEPAGRQDPVHKRTLRSMSPAMVESFKKRILISVGVLSIFSAQLWSKAGFLSKSF